MCIKWLNDTKVSPLWLWWKRVNLPPRGEGTGQNECGARRVSVRVVWAGLTLLMPTGVEAGGGPQNVAVVVNGMSWASRTVANHYVRMRSIPAGNVVLLSGVPARERVKVSEFREAILAPTLRALAMRGIEEHIDYIVYSVDFPFAVDVGADMEGRHFPKTIGRWGSLTGLTFLYEGVLRADVDYLNLATNWYFRKEARTKHDHPWSAEELEEYGKVQSFFVERGHRRRSREKQKTNAQVKGGGDAAGSAESDTAGDDSRWEQEQWRQALDILDGLLVEHPNAMHVSYNLACAQAVLGEPERALVTLARSVESGYRDHRHVAQDEDLVSLRGRDDFAALIERMGNVDIKLMPSVGFSSSVGWGPNGELLRPFKGARYRLSTMLGYTRGRGNSVTEVVGYLERSIGADAHRPQGTVYLMENGNIRSRTRDWAFPSVVRRLAELGVAAEIGQGVVPKGKSEVAGAVVGSATFDWPQSGSAILPGAICEHLTSSGGVLSEQATQTPLTAFLRYGAAGASGTVAEPYAIQAKFPVAFLQVHYARGCSLAEAFYQSVSGPYQLLVVGDALCQPWAIRPQLALVGLEPGATVNGQVALEPQIPEGTGQGVARVELFVDGRRIATIAPGASHQLETTRLADGLHELRAVGVARGPIQTQGWLIVPFQVNNNGHRVEAALSSGAALTFAQALTVRLEATGATSVELRHHGECLARIEGGQGEVEVAARRLGMGPVTLDVVGQFGDGPTVRGKLLHVSVLPPPLLAAVDRGEAASALEDGLLLSVAEREPVVVPRIDATWMKSAGLEPGTQFSLTGWFDVPGADVYQFSIAPVHDKAAARLHINEQPALEFGADGQDAVPVHLAAGWHRMRLDATAPASGRLDLRFGGPGMRLLDGSRFRHVRLAADASLPAQ